jgi:hypothetical protein
MRKTLSLPESAEQVIFEYMHLPLGDKEVVCPYYINKTKERAGLRVLIGKGDPGEIVREVNVWAKLKGFNLRKASAAEIRKFMVDHSIGVDCSAFVVHLLNYWFKQEGRQPLINYLKFPHNGLIDLMRRTLRPVENISANILTSQDNCIAIDNLNGIRPGDFIRSKGHLKNSHHIALVRNITLEEGVVKEFEYVHSERYYGDENGVRFGKVIVTNPKGELKDQNWTEVMNGKNYTLEGLLNMYEDNGIRRLRILNQ